MHNLLKHLLVFAIALVVSTGGYHMVVGSGTAGSAFSTEAVKRVVEGFSLKEDYQLKELDLLERDLFRIESRYVDKDRFDPNAMFKGALDRVQRDFAEVMFFRGDAGGTRLHVSVGAFSTVLYLEPIEDFSGLHRELLRVAQVLDENLSDEVKRPEVEYAMVNGVLDTLDPHSLLMPPQAAREMAVDNSGEFGGLGIEITMQEGRLTVKVPLEDTPAFRAGLKPQDHIVRIEGESTINIDLQDAVDKLRGPVGAPVNIMVMRKGFSSPRRFNIVRERIRLNPLEGELLEGGIGYIKIKSFSRNTARDLEAELVRFRRELKGELKGLVLDLRMNPGGYLNQAVDVSDKFLKDGVIVATVEGGTGERSEQRATMNGTEPAYPMVVLVNGASASASEIVAGAIRNRERGVIVGERTFGKGSVQHLYGHRDDSQLKLTVAKYLTPGDQSIQSIGIAPDIRLIPSRVDVPEKPEEPDPYSLVELPHVSLFAREHLSRESSLDNNLGEGKTKAEDAAYKVRYLLEPRDRDAPRGLDPQQDWEVQFAREVVLAAPGSRRADMLLAAGAVVARAQEKENRRLLEAFTAVGMDWSKGEVVEEVKLGVTLDLGKDKVLTAGVPENVGMTVTNNGASALSQVSAVTESKNPWMDKREFHFGRLEPGGSRTFYQRTWLHSGYALEAVPVKITLHSQGKPIHTMTQTVRTAARKLPRLAYTVAMKDDGSGKSKGNSDGAAQQGEVIELQITIENLGEGPTGDAFVRLKNRSGRALDLQKGSVEVGTPRNVAGDPCKVDTPGCRHRLDPGEKFTTRLRFSLDLVPDDGDWNLVLNVGDARAYDYGTVQRGGFTEYFQLEEKLTLTSGGTIGDHQRNPPFISVTRSPEVQTKDVQAVISGVVEEDRGIRDVMIFHGENKIFYRGGNDKTRTMPFTVEQGMKAGPNSFFVLARDKDGLTASRMLSVWLEDDSG
jgi:carboxyl-terminal processing protease